MRSCYTRERNCFCEGARRSLFPGDQKSGASVKIFITRYCFKWKVVEEILMLKKKNKFSIAFVLDLSWALSLSLKHSLSFFLLKSRLTPACHPVILTRRNRTQVAECSESATPYLLVHPTEKAVTLGLPSLAYSKLVDVR